MATTEPTVLPVAVGKDESRRPGFARALALFFAAEFPRIVFAGNSSHCIKTAADKGHDF